jgi:integrase
MTTRPIERKLLTDAIVDNLPAPEKGNKIHYDADDPTEKKKKAVTGLGCRVTASGTKSFIFNYRTRSGLQRRITIGAPPAWKVSAAREEAKRLSRLVDQGLDPMGERHEERAAPSVTDLISRWRAEHAPRKRERSRKEDESLIRQWIAPALGKRKAADVRRSDIDRLHRKISDSGTPVRANRTVTVLSKLFTLAVRWDMRTDNPASGIERNNEEPRHRYLSGDELRRLVEALIAHPNQQAANAVRLLLLTGARRGEVLRAMWDQFDLETGVWTKPSAHTKQKRTHRVPLSAPARQLLAEMEAPAEQPSPYLFPGRGIDGPMIEIKAAWGALCRAANLKDVRLHDLRHTYASVLASAGLSLPVIGALLGHTQPGTTARYAHLFDDPLRQATERVGALVMGNGVRESEQASDVVPFDRARR